MWPYATNRLADHALIAALVAAIALAHVGALLLWAQPPARVVLADTRVTMDIGAERPRSPVASQPKPAQAPIDRKPEPQAAAEPIPEETEPIQEVVAAETGSEAVFNSEAEQTPGGYSAAGQIDLTATIIRRLQQFRVYPMAARRRGISGEVLVRFTLRPDGSLVRAVAESEDAHSLLRRAAVDSVVAAAPFPLPRGITEDMEFVVTVVYQLND